MFATFQKSIVDRLREKMPEYVRVEEAISFEAAYDRRHKAPAVFVIYQGMQAAAVTPNIPHVQQVQQTWGLLHVVKTARGAGDPVAANPEISAMAEQSLIALLGYSVSPGVRLYLAGAPEPQDDAGFQYFPVGFSCRSTFKGDPS